MKKEDLDAILSAMLRSAEKRVSDFVFVSGKPPQIEQDGALSPLEMEGPEGVLQPAHIDQMAELLIAGNERLLSEFEQNGSCDSSYAHLEVRRRAVRIPEISARPHLEI